MSRDDLREMLADLAEDVSRAELVGAAVAGAARVRRRRRVVAGAAVAVLATTLAAVAWWTPPSGPPPASTPASPDQTAIPSSSTIRIDRLWAPVPAEPGAAPIWPTSIAPPSAAPRLARGAMSHAVLLAGSASAEGDAPPPIYAYGEGSVNAGSGDGTFGWHELDVDLTFTRDVNGNRVAPLDLGSLGPMGGRAAFAQPDAVVVVDIRTTEVSRIPVPGLNEEVTWLPTGDHVLVSSATQTWLVNVDTRAVVEINASGFDVTSLVGGASGLTTLSESHVDGPPTLRVFDDGGGVVASSREVDASTARPYSIGRLYPRGWRYGNLVAQAARGWPGTRTGEVVAVVDVRDATVAHLLDLREPDPKGCCAVLGWTGGGDKVLVRTERDGLLVWNLPTGEVTRLSDPGTGVVSVAPSGCDWEVTIDDVTSACTR